MTIKRRTVAVALVVLAGLAIAGLTGCEILGLGGPDFSPDPITGFGIDDWTFGSGYVEVGFDEGTWAVDLYPVAPNTGFEPWEFGAYDSSDNKIFFTTTSTAEPKELQLKLLGDTSANQTITYFDGTTNFIITQGWIHLQVNETAGTATVQLDVGYDEIWFNGTVTVDIAP